MRKIVTTIFCITVLLSAAQTDTILSNTSASHHAIGIAAGYTTGNGLSYRFHKNRFSVQTTVFPYYRKKESEELFLFSGGIALMFDITNTDNFRFYAYEGNHIYCRNENNKNKIRSLNHGLGFGVEKRSENISVNIMLGYGYRNKRITSSYDETETEFGVFPTIEGGIYYLIR